MSQFRTNVLEHHTLEQIQKEYTLNTLFNDYFFNIQTMIEVFRDDSVQDANGNIIQLKYKPIKELFKWQSQPYIVVGASGAGKTTIALDIITQFCSEATNIYYVTKTKESFKDSTIAYVPKAWRRSPDFESLSAIFREMVNANESANLTDESLSRLLIELVGDTNGKELLRQIDEYSNKVVTDCSKMYAKNRYSTDQAMEQANLDAKVFQMEALTRLCTSYAKEYGSDRLSKQNITTLQALYSKKPKTILILDDVSSELESLKSNNSKVVYDGRQMKTKDAYSQLLMDILTRGRHYDCMIYLFVHTINVITRKELIKNLVVLDSPSVQNIRNLKTINESVRNVLLTCSQNVFTDKFKWHFIHLTTDLSPTAPVVYVSKATAHYRANELTPSPEMQILIDTYNDVNKGINTLTDDNTTGTVGISFNENDNEDGDDYDSESIEDTQSLAGDFMGSIV